MEQMQKRKGKKQRKEEKVEGGDEVEVEVDKVVRVHESM